MLLTGAEAGEPQPHRRGLPDLPPGVAQGGDPLPGRHLDHRHNHLQVGSVTEMNQPSGTSYHSSTSFSAVCFLRERLVEYCQTLL